FWALFLPLGAVFSLDAALSRGQGSGVRSQEGGRSASTLTPDPCPLTPGRVVSAGSVAFILQVCLVYWFAAVWKWAPVWRTEGTAVFHALHVDHLTTRFGRWLLGFPDLLKLLTFATLVLETLGPVCLFVPFATGPVRVGVILSMVLFHAGLGLCLALSNF